MLCRDSNVTCTNPLGLHVHICSGQNKSCFCFSRPHNPSWRQPQDTGMCQSHNERSDFEQTCMHANHYLEATSLKTQRLVSHWHTLHRSEGQNTSVRSGGFEKSQFLKRQEIKRCLGVFSLRLLGGSSTSCGLLGEEGGLDVGQHTSLSDGHSGQQLVQFFVVPDGQLKVAGIDPLLLVVAGCVSRQLQDFGGKVLHHRGEVHGSSRPDTLGVVPLTKKTVNTSNGELQSCAGRTALGLSAGFASFSTSSHSYLLQSTVRSNNNSFTVSRPFCTS